MSAEFCNRRPPRAFTLVELLVVISIIGILIAILLPAVQSAREAARRMHCSNNMKQIALALHNYYSSYQAFPAAGRGYGMCTGTPANYEIKNSNGLVSLLPYLEQQAIYDKFNHLETYSIGNTRDAYSGENTGSYVGDAGTNGNAAAAEQVLPMFICPSDNTGRRLVGNWYGPAPGFTGAATNYDFITSAFGDFSNCNSYNGSAKETKRMFGEESATTMAQVSDGLTHTFMLGETTKWHVNGCAFAWAYRAWVMTGVDPYPNSTHAGINLWHMPWVDHPKWRSPPFVPVRGRIRSWWSAAASLHPGGCHFAMGDASVQYVSESVEKSMLLHLSTMAGRVHVQLPQ